MIRFLANDLIDDARAIMALGRDGGLLSHESEIAVSSFVDQVHQAGNLEQDALMRLEVRPERPIRTVICDGEYEAGTRKGSERIQAVVSMVWQVAPAEPRTRRTIPNRLLAIRGNASVRVGVWRVGDDDMPLEEIGSWRTESGALDSPGSHFHSSVLGEATQPPFPRSLSTPRHPTLFVTLGDAIDFTLAEFFQEKWRAVSSCGSAAANRWRQLQYPRMRKLLHWQLEQMKGNSGPPWYEIKRAKPPVDLFVDA